MGLCYTVFGITYTILKFGINFPRPFCSLDSFITTIDISKERCLSSFPSSHAGISFITMLLLWDRMNFLSKIGAYIVVITVSTARIGFALHYPADILYSFIIAYLIYLVYLWLYNKIEAISYKMRDIMWKIYSKENKNRADR